MTVVVALQPACTIYLVHLLVYCLALAHPCWVLESYDHHCSERWEENRDCCSEESDDLACLTADPTTLSEMAQSQAV